MASLSILILEQNKKLLMNKSKQNQETIEDRDFFAGPMPLKIYSVIS